MKDGVFYGLNFYRLDEVSAAIRVSAGGDVYIRGGASFSLDQARFEALLSALQSWHESKSRCA